MRPYLTLHHPTVARDYYDAGLWQPDTFYSLLQRNARRRPDDAALQDGRSVLSWAELLGRVDGVAADLRIYGLVPGDRVSIWMSNKIEAVILFLACAREGFACNPSLHRTYTCAEVAGLLNRLSARALLTEEGWGADRATAKFDQLLAGVRSLKIVYTPKSLPVAAPNLSEPSRDPDKVVYLAFTSGTTGAPKCVMHSDNTLLANARELVRDWGQGSETVVMVLAPLSHHIAWVAVSQWLLTGGRFVTDDPPEGMSRLDWILKTGATYVLGVPTHAMDILAEQQQRGLPRLGSVATFYMAGSPIPPSVASAFLAQGVKAQNVYGMTENSSHQYTHPDDDELTIVNTCGRGGNAYRVQIFDAADQDVALPAGQIGQIGGKGASLMLGYFDNQTATEGSFNRDGWFMSGDLGILDEKGNLRIEGRIKDVIIRGGHNIYPAHIEAIALRHAQVDRVACFPVADVRLGEKVCIAVIGTVDAGELLEHLAREGLSRFDMPEYFIRLSELPLTPSGKVLKRELVEQVKRGEIAPIAIRYQARTPA
ncbi:MULTISPECIES: class I adenylate-forming enzyme family protein [unclassified Mesorhizobium]|uniref:class I adenylate-forming enzyme family protein n=1 Tax=unclassified Mesorhizobium TaxID=325217 RepID=UPI00241784AD|nr:MULTISPECIES: class I adenylate-forming enzyme family protein [unclassified Mesorhizobium]WFP65561.1 class I adenylate-forming enzyme family protein [Mesorhizobium sp. WSM4904]WFP78826.1 class I adenylate-forming enzyme family protein [Mesorhizobium sp. WSM4906]